MSLFVNENFEVSYHGVVLQITEHSLGKEQVFHILFADHRPELVITTSSTVNGKMWMSIPQGRQKEAGEIGVLISGILKRDNYVLLQWSKGFTC